MAPHTWLKLGGPAQFFLTPRDVSQLQQILKHCHQHEIPVRLLGGGSNLLVRDEGVSGAVVQLRSPEFSQVSVAAFDPQTQRTGILVTAGAGALLSHVISETVRAGLAGLENLAGIPGTIGGAIRGNAGGRYGDIGQYTRQVTALKPTGELVTLSAEDLAFGYRQSAIGDLIIVEVQLSLSVDDSDEIARRLRKIWILKKSSQPLASQSAGCIFKNPRGLSAGSLIEQAGLKGTRVGGAEVSDRHANFIVTHPQATSADVLRLMDLIRSKVVEQFGVELEAEVKVW